MPQRISKKIFIYLLIFFSLATINNKKFSNLNFPKITDIEILGLDDNEITQVYSDIKYLKNKNLFFLDKLEISNKLYSNKIFEKIFISKMYPSKLKIIIEKTNLLAIIKQENFNYYLGSNGKLIKVEGSKKKLPFIFGKIDAKEFLKFKKLIDESNFDFNNIKNFYFFKSKRWDIELQDGLIIKLPLKQIDVSLEILNKILMDKEFEDSTIIDLRQKGQIIKNGWY